MPARRTIFQKGESYHLYNRGNNSQTIFLIEENYHFFLDRMSEAFPVGLVELQAFTLMPNHYHFSIRLNESFDVSDTMKKFLGKYAREFNHQHRRRGYVFEGRFKAIRVESNEYQDYLTRYIHRNPLEAGLVADLNQWEYSSYSCYMNGTGTLSWQHAGKDPSDRGRNWKIPTINPFETLARFATPASYAEFVLCNWERAPWRLENGIWTPSDNKSPWVHEYHPEILSGQALHIRSAARIDYGESLVGS